MKKKTAPAPPPPSPVQNQAFGISDDQRANADATTDTTKQALSGYLPGSTGMSDFRRALTGNMSKAVATTGDNALAHSRERAAAAGFGGGGQPITVGAENELANEQAGRISQIPGQVEQIAAPLELQATGQEAGIASREASNAAGYFNTGTDIEQQRQAEFNRQQEEARKRKSGIWGSLAKIGLNAGLSFLPGGSAVKSGIESLGV